MTITATYAKLVALNAASSGITTAPSELPGSIPDDALPCVLTIVGPASWNQHAVGLYRQVRTYTLRCFVKPVGQGLGPDEGYKLCLAPLYALGRTYVQNPTLDGEVDHIGLRGEFRDSGVINGTQDPRMVLAGTAYYGFDLTLDITEKAS